MYITFTFKSQAGSIHEITLPVHVCSWMCFCLPDCLPQRVFGKHALPLPWISFLWKLKRHQIIGMDYHASNKTTTRVIHEALCMLNYVYIENLSTVCEHTPWALNAEIAIAPLSLSSPVCEVEKQWELLINKIDRQFTQRREKSRIKLG